MVISCQRSVSRFQSIPDRVGRRRRRSAYSPAASASTAGRSPRLATLRHENKGGGCRRIGVGGEGGAGGELAGRGAEVPLSLQVKVEQNRFTDEVARIKASGADAIYYAGYEVECPYLRADLRDAGLGGLTFMASDGCFLAATIDNSDGAAEGMYVTGFAPSPKTAVDQAWTQAYQAVEYRNPDTYSVNGYSAMEVLVEGVKKAGSLSAPEIADAIRGLDVTTSLGKVQFQDNGDLREARIYIFQVKGGEFVQVSP